MPHRFVVALAALALAAPWAVASARAGSAETPTAFMKAVDTNSDGTISKKELDAYAKKRFAALERDNDKTLDQKELKGRLNAAGMKRADTDKDKTVDEAEFAGYANKLFDLANNRGDKTLSVRELGTPAGEKLIRLLH